MSPDPQTRLLALDVLLRAPSAEDCFSLADGIPELDGQNLQAKLDGSSREQLWCVQDRMDERPVGWIDLGDPNRPDFRFVPHARGRGWATQVLWLLLVHWARNIADRICIPSSSPAARRVAERCGYLCQESGSDGLELKARNKQRQRLMALGEYYRQQARRRVQHLHRELGLPADYATRRGLTLVPEAPVLVCAERDCADRELWLAPDTQQAWQRLRSAAQEDGVQLQAVSGFRDLYYQAGLIRRKLDSGLGLDDILKLSAAPGYSEHHGGHALDLSTPGCAPLEEEFEETDAFDWLSQHAQRHGFRLSYPRDNPHGIAYEPWHWAFHGHSGVTDQQSPEPGTGSEPV